MRIAISLCFLAIFCTADATLLNILLRQVLNAKRDVESTIGQLERIHDTTQQDVDLTVMKQWLQKMEEYNSYANSILDTIRKEVDDAKAKGKNAQPCYDAALNIFKNIDYVAVTDTQQCRENAKCSIVNNLEFIDTYMRIGRELIGKLDNIFPDCYEKNARFTDIIKLHSCIKSQLGINQINVKNLKTDVSSAKATAKNAFDIVIEQFTICLNNAYSTAHSEVTEARSTATRCLSNL